MKHPIIPTAALKFLGFSEQEVVTDEGISYQSFDLSQGDSIIEVINDIDIATGKVKSQGLYICLELDDCNIDRSIDISTLEAAVALMQRLYDNNTAVVTQPDGTVDAISQELENELQHLPVAGYEIIKGH